MMNLRIVIRKYIQIWDTIKKTQYSDSYQHKISNMHFHQQNHYQAIPTSFQRNCFNVQYDQNSQYKNYSQAISQHHDKNNDLIQAIQNENNCKEPTVRDQNNDHIDVVQTHNEKKMF